MAEQSDNWDKMQTLLSVPSGDLAQKIMMRVPWEKRLEGSVYVDGPGDLVQYFFKLEEVYNLLKSEPDFSVSIEGLKQWIAEAIGDKELADAISAFGEGGPPPSRETIVELLGMRLNQCRTTSNEEREG